MLKDNIVKKRINKDWIEFMDKQTMCVWRKLGKLLKIGFSMRF